MERAAAVARQESEKTDGLTIWEEHGLDRIERAVLRTVLMKLLRACVHKAVQAYRPMPKLLGVARAFLAKFVRCDAILAPTAQDLLENMALHLSPPPERAHQNTILGRVFAGLPSRPATAAQQIPELGLIHGGCSGNN